MNSVKAVMTVNEMFESERHGMTGENTHILTRHLVQGVKH